MYKQGTVLVTEYVGVLYLSKPKKGEYLTNTYNRGNMVCCTSNEKLVFKGMVRHLEAIWKPWPPLGQRDEGKREKVLLLAPSR